MSKIVYALHEGIYSDRSLEGVFSSKEKAEKFIELLTEREKAEHIRIYGDYDFDSYKKYDITEVTIDFGLDKLSAGYNYYQVTMDRDGGRASAYDETEYMRAGEMNQKIEIRKNINAKYFSIYIFAKDEAHAIKIANEKRIGHLLQQDLIEKDVENDSF